MLYKNKIKKNIELEIEGNEQEKRNLNNSIAEKSKFREKVILILNAIGDIDDVSRFNRGLLNLIISTLNNCYDKITEYLNSNYQGDKNDEVVFPDWFEIILGKLPQYNLP